MNEIEEIVWKIEKLNRGQKKELFEKFVEQIDEQMLWDVLGDWVIEQARDMIANGEFRTGS